MPTPRRRTLLLVVLLLAATAAAWWSASQGRPREALPADAVPAGRWHRPQGGAVEEGADPERRVRLLSLPYLAASARASGAGGVTVSEARSQPGVNLYTSGHAPDALLIDSSGRLLHRWSVPFGRAFPDLPPTQESHFFRTAQLLPDGGLLAMFQGGGLVRLDRRSRVVWASEQPLYNDVSVDGDRAWSLAKRAVTDPDLAADRQILEDSVVALDLASGRVLVRHSLLAALRGSPASARLLDEVRGSDVFHANAVRPLGSELVGVDPALGPGRLLVSIRQLSLLLALDAGTGDLVWATRGPWKRQHDPRPLAGGRLLLFDNQGLEGASRAIEVDPSTVEILWQYPATAGLLRSPESGAVQRLANGNTLITESENGRALEVTPDGEIVWEFRSPHRAGPNGELVATLFEVRRLPRPDWLPDDG